MVNFWTIRKVGFVKGRFWRIYPRPGFWYYRSGFVPSFGSLVPSFLFWCPRCVFWCREISVKTILLETILLRTPEPHINDQEDVQGPLNGGVSNGGGVPDLDLSFLFCPFWSFPDFFRDFPFPLSRPINSAYEEQSRKGLRHNLDLSRKKWETPRFGNPPVYPLPRCDRYCRDQNYSGSGKIFSGINF